MYVAHKKKHNGGSVACSLLCLDFFSLRSVYYPLAVHWRKKKEKEKTVKHQGTALNFIYSTVTAILH